MLISKEEAIHVLYAEIKPITGTNFYSVSLGYDHPIDKDHMLDDHIRLKRHELTEFGSLLIKHSGKHWICTTIHGRENKDVLFAKEFILSFYVEDRKVVCTTFWNKVLVLPYSQELVDKLKAWEKDWEIK